MDTRLAKLGGLVLDSRSCSRVDSGKHRQALKNVLLVPTRMLVDLIVLCHPFPALELPRRAIYTTFRGGIAETPCPYKCISERYHMPHCHTALEELIYTIGGPWLLCCLLVGLLILLAVVLSVARMKFVGVDELPGPAPTQHGSQIDHLFPFLESLNEVLETNRVEESQSHVQRMYFMGPDTFSEPWHLPHTPPEEIKEIVRIRGCIQHVCG